MIMQKPWLGMELNRKHPLAKGLVLATIFNEATGNKVFDLSGNNNNGTIHGADWVPDGLDFNGVDNYIITTNTPILGGGDRTVSLWMYKDNTVDHETFVWWGGESGGTDGERWEFRVDATNKDVLRVEVQGGYVYGVTDVDEGWHHVTAVQHGNNTTDIDLYIDGVKETIGASVARVINTSADNVVHIGCHGSGGTLARYFGGIIAYVYIYNRSLSPAEIASLNADPYQMFKQPIKPELMDYTASGAGWTGKMCGVTNPGEINGVAVANISKVMGI